MGTKRKFTKIKCPSSAISVLISDKIISMMQNAAQNCTGSEEVGVAIEPSWSRWNESEHSHEDYSNDVNQRDTSSNSVEDSVTPTRKRKGDTEIFSDESSKGPKRQRHTDRRRKQFNK